MNKVQYDKVYKIIYNLTLHKYKNICYDGTTAKFFFFSFVV